MDLHEKYSKEPIKLNFQRTDHKEGSATYLREYLRRYMTATKPVRSEYQSWQKVQFVIDSIAWEQDPLYGWCNKNKNKDVTEKIRLLCKSVGPAKQTMTVARKDVGALAKAHKIENYFTAL